MWLRYASIFVLANCLAHAFFILFCCRACIQHTDNELSCHVGSRHARSKFVHVCVSVVMMSWRGRFIFEQLFGIAVRALAAWDGESKQRKRIRICICIYCCRPTHVISYHWHSLTKTYHHLSVGHVFLAVPLDLHHASHARRNVLRLWETRRTSLSHIPCFGCGSFLEEWDPDGLAQSQTRESQLPCGPLSTASLLGDMV